MHMGMMLLEPRTSTLAALFVGAADLCVMQRPDEQRRQR